MQTGHNLSSDKNGLCTVNVVLSTIIGYCRDSYSNLVLEYTFFQILEGKVVLGINGVVRIAWDGHLTARSASSSERKGIDY